MNVYPILATAHPTAIILTPLHHSLDNNDKFQRTNPNPKVNPN